MGKKFEITESFGDNILSDVSMSKSQLTVVGKLQNALIGLEEKQAEFAEYLDEINRRSEEIKDLKEKLYDMMVESGAKKIQSDYMTITATKAYDVQGVDLKFIKEVNPALWTQLREIAPKDTHYRGHVNITTKDNK